MRTGMMKAFAGAAVAITTALVARGGSAAVDPVEYVRSQLAAGAKSVTVPAGTYELDTKEKAYFDLAGLNDMTIDFSGAKLLGRRKTRMFALSGCTNVVIRNLVIDYPRELPFTEGVIEKVEGEGVWTVRILDGYPLPTDAEIAKDGDFWPLQVYGRDSLELVNPMRFRDNIRIERLDGPCYRISGGTDRRGNAGDYVVWSIRGVDCQRDAIDISRSKRCRLEDVTVYSTPMGCGFNESDCEANTYLRCRLTRCPEAEDPVRRAFRRLRSGNHDSLNARRDYVGPVIDGCDFEYSCDDHVNISGFLSVVTKVSGDAVLVLPYASQLRIDEGDECQVLLDNTRVAADVKVLKIVRAPDPTEEDRERLKGWNFQAGIGNGLRKAWALKLDRPADFPAGSCIISKRRKGDGFVIRNSHFGSTRARGVLIKASDGVIENNRFEKHGSSIVQHAEFNWLEGGVPLRNRVEGNVIAR